MSNPLFSPEAPGTDINGNCIDLPSPQTRVTRNTVSDASSPATISLDHDDNEAMTGSQISRPLHEDAHGTESRPVSGVISVVSDDTENDEAVVIISDADSGSDTDCYFVSESEETASNVKENPPTCDGVTLETTEEDCTPTRPASSASVSVPNTDNDVTMTTPNLCCTHGDDTVVDKRTKPRKASTRPRRRSARIRSDHRQEIKCVTCYRKFFTQNALNIHMASHETTCEKCSRQFSNRPALHDHVKYCKGDSEPAKDCYGKENYAKRAKPCIDQRHSSRVANHMRKCICEPCKFGFHREDLLWWHLIKQHSLSQLQAKNLVASSEGQVSVQDLKQFENKQRYQLRNRRRVQKVKTQRVQRFSIYTSPTKAGPAREPDVPEIGDSPEEEIPAPVDDLPTFLKGYIQVHGKRVGTVYTRAKLKCSCCGLRFRVAEELRVHNQRRHGLVILKVGKRSKKRYKCTLCMTYFVDEDTYMEHQFVHAESK